MNVSGLTSKLVSNADKLGLAAGLLVGSNEGVEGFVESIRNAASGHVHLPDWVFVKIWAQDRPQLTQAIMAYIAGYLIDEINPPVIGKYGKAIQKGSIGYAAGSFLNAMLWSSTHSGEGGGTTTMSGTYPY